MLMTIEDVRKAIASKEKSRFMFFEHGSMKAFYDPNREEFSAEVDGASVCGTSKGWAGEFVLMFNNGGKEKRPTLKVGSNGEIAFSMRFSQRLACRFFVNELENETQNFGRVVWDGKLEPKFVSRYIKWMNSIMETLSTRWNISIIRIYQVSPSIKDLQFFRFNPTEKAERLSQHEYENWILRN